MVKSAKHAAQLALLLLSGCHRGLPPAEFHADGKPTKLSDWHMVEARDGRLELNAGVVPYNLNTPLFTDYVHKLRTVWMPKGVSAKYDAKNTFDFPVGTVVTKTFYYPRAADGKFSDVARTLDYSGDFVGQDLNLASVHLVETRLLVRRKDGWTPFVYVWNKEQTEATLVRTGDVQALTLVGAQDQREDFNYVVPDEGQCVNCHEADMIGRSILPIGPKARNMNREYDYGSGRENQLEHLVAMGYLMDMPKLADVPKAADWRDPSATLDARARAWLDVNCAMCHNPNGEASVTGFSLGADVPEDHHLGICKSPEAAGPATGGRLFDIVPGKPDDSIIMNRIGSTRPGTMMPEIGRSTVDREGEALIRAWILSLKGNCDIVH
ncbi:SO2930 family diheme c-type cytochrome [Rhodanobacter hydrolyticus]|uniref:Repeat protein (TIGR03806 family) n=1 Tax=Rhodanobacter hydrolyticus TaxID=2250595 RepID=A0ABW8J880_9GAMM